MFKEFKKFAMRGNIIDLAIGVIIGAAFKSIVDSLVADIIMPIISIFTGKVNLTTLSINIGEISIKYGSFLTNILNFLIISFSVFLLVKYINKMNENIEKFTNKNIEKMKKFKWFKNSKKEEPEELPTTKICPYCISEIDIKATKCKYCASDFSPIDNKTT